MRVVAERGADVVPLLNGVTAADELKAGGVPPSRVLGGLARVSVVRTEPGVVERLMTRVNGVQFEIPVYKYDTLFKPEEELLEKPPAPAAKPAPPKKSAGTEKKKAG